MLVELLVGSDGVPQTDVLVGPVDGLGELFIVANVDGPSLRESQDCVINRCAFRERLGQQ